MRLVDTCVTCSVTTRIHAKAQCKRCYLRAYNRTSERIERRRQYIAANRDQVLESYRRYNEKRYPTPGSQDALVRVPVKGWGCR